MAYHINNIIKAIKETRDLTGSGRSILLRALNGSQNWIIPGGRDNVAVLVNYDDRSTTLLHGALSTSEQERLHIMTVTGNFFFDYIGMVEILFWMEDLGDLVSHLTANPINWTMFNQVLRERLKDKGLELDPHVRFHSL